MVRWSWVIRTLFATAARSRISARQFVFNDLLANVKADYVLANPPFNDGSKGGWGAERVRPRTLACNWASGASRFRPRNGNTMWILHFLYHLKHRDGGVRDGYGRTLER